MPGLIFQDQAPVAPSSPNRMDSVLFVGFVRTATPLVIPPELEQWFEERGWKSSPYATANGPYARANDVATLQDVPVPIQSLLQFEALFDWQNRTTDPRDGVSYLGAAVRSFFAQGGRTCYVVRAGDPLKLEATRAERRQQVATLIPGYPARFLPSAADRQSWQGAGHLFGLPDVSFLVMPDLAEAFANDRVRVSLPDPPAGPPEVFVECTLSPPAPKPDRTVRDIAAPVCSEDGFEEWGAALELVTRGLARCALEVQYVAALPIAEGALRFASAPAKAFVQLAYPWLRTPGSVGLAGGVESPDGVLAGILARNALFRGSFLSAASLHLADVSAVFPVLDRAQQQRDRLIERVSLFGPTPSGLQLLSDVTMSVVETERPASVRRLIAAIARAARRIGEDVTFEPSGEQLWSDIRGRLDTFMRRLYKAGIFRGASAGDAYQVRCSRDTMTQNDIDNGRVIAIVHFDPAVPIDTITVVLTVTDSRRAPAVQGEAA